MSTQRYISTSFWDDEWVQTLNLTEKGLFLYFLTNALTNIAGVYKISVSRILFDTKLEESDFKTIFAKFEKAGKARRYKEYILIPKWPKHQKWETHGKIKTGIEAILKNLPKEIIAILKKIGYTYPIDSLCIPYLTQAQSENDKNSGSNYSDSDSDSDSNTNTDSNIKSDGSNEPQLSESQKSAIELAELLLTSHRKEFPDYLSGKNDTQTIQRWALDIEKLIRLDKKSPDIIRQVILWVKTPNRFWFQNIESGKKLREKFERLYGEWKTDGNKRPGAKTTPLKIDTDNVKPDDLENYYT
jgi:hypothetical protein